MLNTLLALLVALAATRNVATAAIPVFARPLRLWLTINARQNLVEVWWQNAPALPGDQIKVIDLDDYVPHTVVYTIDVLERSSSHKTNLAFNYTLPRNITVQTKCYAYMAIYENTSKRVLDSACIRAYPTWMHDMQLYVDGLRMCDLLLPGTHDSGAYKTALSQNILAKFTVTQDDDIWSQLMHGVRYLDMRIGFDPGLEEKFHVYHGRVRFATLRNVIHQVKKFVFETHEVVVFGLKEFPVGFDGPNSLEIHNMLASYLQYAFNDVFVNPALTWNATLREIWDQNQYVFIAYEHEPTLKLFPKLLFSPVKQFWGNVNTRETLKSYLRIINSDPARRLEIPTADMAELTPRSVDIVLGRNLRQMADDVNPVVSMLYRDELVANVNIVAVDFFRGTCVVQTALDRNLKAAVQSTQNERAFEFMDINAIVVSADRQIHEIILSHLI